MLLRQVRWHSGSLDANYNGFVIFFLSKKKKQSVKELQCTCKLCYTEKAYGRKRGNATLSVWSEYIADCGQQNKIIGGINNEQGNTLQDLFRRARDAG